MKYNNRIVHMCIFFIIGGTSIVNCKQEICKEHNFKCRSGQCIDDDYLCDGKADCADKSDEINDICSTIHCPRFAFTCKYGACISRKHICNGVKNCIDNSDEEHCSKQSEKHEIHRPSSVINHNSNNVRKGKYICQSGEIINEDLLCDGASDCQDNSDETEKICMSIYCPYFTFRCNYGACIPLTKKCDGENNCIDGSDEKLCASNSTIIPEILTTTTPKPIKKSFHCNSGEIIDEDSLCDGEPDCADQSDETVKECSQFLCPGFTYKCKYGACVRSGARCNGIKECIDNSDETSCAAIALQISTIVVEKFKCKSGQPINADLVCDGKADCRDSSDETSSTCAKINCPNFAFQCSYGGCVHGTSRCNGIKDCFDNSDEHLCPTQNKSVTKDKEAHKDYLVFT